MQKFRRIDGPWLKSGGCAVQPERAGALPRAVAIRSCDTRLKARAPAPFRAFEPRRPRPLAPACPQAREAAARSSETREQR